MKSRLIIHLIDKNSKELDKTDVSYLEEYQENYETGSSDVVDKRTFGYGVVSGIGGSAG